MIRRTQGIGIKAETLLFDELNGGGLRGAGWREGVREDLRLSASEFRERDQAFGRARIAQRLVVTMLKGHPGTSIPRSKAEDATQGVKAAASAVVWSGPLGDGAVFCRMDHVLPEDGS
jgi:hypothetical protein